MDSPSIEEKGRDRPQMGATVTRPDLDVGRSMSVDQTRGVGAPHWGRPCPAFVLSFLAIL